MYIIGYTSQRGHNWLTTENWRRIHWQNRILVVIDESGHQQPHGSLFRVRRRPSGVIHEARICSRRPVGRRLRKQIEQESGNDGTVVSDVTLA
jgi:hypothetical protein